MNYKTRKILALRHKIKKVQIIFLIPAGSAVLNIYNENVDGRCKL
jgi:hypothetical protein